MKKRTVSILALWALFFVISSPAISKSFAGSAYQEAESAGDYSDHAAGSTSLEQARSEAGNVFDTAVPDAVDLSDAGEHPTPALLRNSDGSNPYTPQRYRSLQPSAVPPLQ